MLVRVLIHRLAKENREKEMLNLILGMRSHATRQPGYVSGETLVDTENPHSILIISTWHALEDWQRWESSPEHQDLLRRIDPLLQEPSSVRICVNPWDALQTSL